jgi:hypothetical protein
VATSDLLDIGLTVLRLLLVLNLIALAIVLRRVRLYVLEVPAPDFLKAAPAAPLGIVSSSLATGVVAALALLIVGAPVPSVALLLATGLAFLWSGSLRAHLIAAAATGLTLGHHRARFALRFFDALRRSWRPRRVLPAMATAAVICVIELAAFLLLFATLGIGGAGSALAAVIVLRAAATAYALPGALAAEEESIVPAGHAREDASTREDLAA